MTFDEIFQQYADYGFTKPMAGLSGIETIDPIMMQSYIPDTETYVNEPLRDDRGITSIPTNQIDYTQVPSMLSQYMQPTGIIDVASMILNPVTYVGKNLIDYARDQSLAQDVQEMGIGFGGATSQDRAGGGGFGGDTAGGFDESDPTATEGSF